jgi:hypothetical protein
VTSKLLLFPENCVNVSKTWPRDKRLKRLLMSLKFIHFFWVMTPFCRHVGRTYCLSLLHCTKITRKDDYHTKRIPTCTHLLLWELNRTKSVLGIDNVVTSIWFPGHRDCKMAFHEDRCSNFRRAIIFVTNTRRKADETLKHVRVCRPNIMIPTEAEVYK